MNTSIQSACGTSSDTCPLCGCATYEYGRIGIHMAFSPSVHIAVITIIIIQGLQCVKATAVTVFSGSLGKSVMGLIFREMNRLLHKPSSIWNGYPRNGKAQPKMNYAEDILSRRNTLWPPHHHGPTGSSLFLTPHSVPAVAAKARHLVGLHN